MSQPVRSTIQLADAKGVIRHGGEWLVLWSDPESLKSGAERARERAHATRRGEHERYLAAALRGVAHRPQLRVLFRGEVPEASLAEVVLPALPTEPSPRSLAVARGLADAIAVYLRWHDPALHTALAPAEPRRRAVFDVLERARCEALGIAELPGMRHNLTVALEDRLTRLGLARAHLAAQIPVREALRMTARDVLSDAAEPSIASNGMEMWDRFLRRRLGRELAALRIAVGDQHAFARAALVAVEALAAAMAWEEGGPRRRPAPSVPEASGLERIEPGGTRLGEARMLVDLAGAARDDATLGAVAHEGGDAGLPLGSRQVAGRPEAAADAPRYRAFMTTFDQVVPAELLAPPSALAERRHQLDTALREMRGLLTRLTHRLQRRLLARQLRAWDFDQEEGLLDAARLDRVVVNPGTALSFKRERESDFKDTVVALLIDNSGSMRGRPILIAAMAADLVARALERCGIACEVLGFTTGAWKGGRPQAAWAAAGRPPSPGRLNELLHIVYKPASVPWRRARLAFGIMLEPRLLKENVDGEALLWARGRLLARPEQRKLLIVVSDGAPVDQATLLANDEAILDRHLREVIARIEAEGAIELAAIGLRHDVGAYYRRAITVADESELGRVLVGQLSGLLVPSVGGGRSALRSPAR